MVDLVFGVIGGARRRIFLGGNKVGGLAGSFWLQQVNCQIAVRVAGDGGLQGVFVLGEDEDVFASAEWGWLLGLRAYFSFASRDFWRKARCGGDFLGSRA